MDGKFKVGDKVVLGKHTEYNGTYNWSPDMDRYVGRIATITHTIYDNNIDWGLDLYVVDIDKGTYHWRGISLTLYSTSSSIGTSSPSSKKPDKCAVCKRCRTPAPWVDFDPEFQCYSCRH